VGFGSYAAYPGLKIASKRKIPVLIHEQNCVPGKATRWLARDADCVAVSFEETLADENLRLREVVGLPIRSALRKAAMERKKDGERFRILVVGGSQGAHRLNEVVLETFSQLSSEEKTKIAVMHITGMKDHEWVAQRYRQINIQAETFPFFDKMHELYRRSDLAITRAGANTLFELALFKLPAVVIPYPYAGAHQKANADYFAAEEGILTRGESVLDSGWLLEQIRILQSDSSRRIKMSETISKLAAPDAASRLVELAEKLLTKEKQWITSQAI
jgi:UDP-N-acetylglucosamine--N-acetylmuramyl-(pentapeptide) pyrophosphoryl-undecaprenol N-acetylglucosamine transferase